MGIVVVLQTVLQELRHLNLSVYRRILALLRHENRNFIFFANEHAAQTSVLRKPAESVNDFNDRLIRLAAQYFSSTVAAQNDCSVILLSNDVAQRVCL